MCALHLRVWQVLQGQCWHLDMRQGGGREGEGRWTRRLPDLPRMGVEMYDKVGGEGRDGAACCRGGWRRPSLHGEGFKGLRRALEDWHTRGDPGPELPGSNRLCWFLSIFSRLQHESSFPHLRQTPAFLLISLPLLYLPIQTQWHVLGRFKGYFVLMYTDAAMLQISDANITDEFLGGDSTSDFSLLFTSACLLSRGSCPPRGTRYKSPELSSK